jgi:transposase
MENFMARSKLINKLDSTQPIYVGLDVHKNKWSVCIIHQDEVIENHTIPGEYQPLKSLLAKYNQFKIFSAYEAGFLGFYLHRYLEKDNIRNIVVSPNKIPTEVGNYVKTDKRDAKKIAFSLSKNLISGIYIPTPELSNFREILRLRSKITKLRVQAINRIKMLLLKQEIKTTQVGLTKAKIKELRELDLPEHTKFTLEQYFDQLDLFNKQRNQLQSRAHSAAMNSPYMDTYKIINTIPGLGPIISAMLCFEIGDFKRFSSGKKLAAYIGLTPREFSSGDNVYRGRITGQGNKLLRSYLVESSWFLIGKDPVMKEFYNRIKVSTGSGKKAIVAVARKLINRIHSIVINNQCYAIGEIE